MRLLSFDGFHPQKLPHSSFKNKRVRTDGRMVGRTYVRTTQRKRKKKKNNVEEKRKKKDLVVNTPAIILPRDVQKADVASEDQMASLSEVSHFVK